MDFEQTELDFSNTVISLYPPDHISYYDKEVLSLNNETHHYAPSYELQEIIAQFKSQPDLLQLILETKIQQDRRRTEEAHLKAKELELVLLQHRLAMGAQPTCFTRQHTPVFDHTSDLDSTVSQPSKHPKSRKRREMQAITRMVETKDHDYVDGHIWRNNGNTIQKKTGNKSVYFKCANSIKGCPVNKTSTYNQMTGEYLIKYRGQHLPECGQVQHIVQI